MILQCNCTSEFQDKKYGKGKRVCNPKKERGYSCTVCGASHGGEKKEKR